MAGASNLMRIEGDNEMRYRLFGKIILCVLGISVLLAVGCSKVTSENYDQLKIGMEYGEVVALLGKADECNSTMGIKKCKWGDDQRQIVVNFAGDKVVLFSEKGL